MSNITHNYQQVLTPLSASSYIVMRLLLHRNELLKTMYEEDKNDVRRIPKT